jgi:hypothetical protein
MEISLDFSSIIALPLGHGKGIVIRCSLAKVKIVFDRQRR